MLGARAFLQLVYQPEVDGIGGTILDKTNGLVAPFHMLEGTTPLRQTGVVEFATLATMEAVLVGAIVIVLVLTFWSELLHMVRRIHAFFERRAERQAERNAAYEALASAKTPCNAAVRRRRS